MTKDVSPDQTKPDLVKPSSAPAAKESLTAKASRAIGLIPPKPELRNFKQLYLKESEQLGDKLAENSVTILKEVGGEPWVTFTPRDRFGLALSGGGIRSATFNLGLAQALAQLGILKEVDYLSTVSGGGYVGGFWMAWLKRKGDKAGEERFPLGNDGSGGEQAEVRHLREFSRFLLPRVGLMETEFWGVAMTVLGGLLPSLTAAIAMLFLYWSVWVSVTGVVLLAKPAGAIWLAVALLSYLFISEWRWTKSSKAEYSRQARIGYVTGSLIGACLMVGAIWCWPELFALKPSAWPAAFADLRFLYPAFLLAAGTLVLLFFRVVLARFTIFQLLVPVLEGFERTLTRFLGLTASLLAFGVMWWAAGAMAGGTKTSISVTAAGAGGSAALFAWAKKWLTSPVEETHGSNLLRTAFNHLKRATPKLLAGLTWLLLFLVIGAAMRRLEIDPAAEHFLSPAYQLVAVISIVILCLTALLFDPARVGMHEFYRSRISRCYLGASNMPEQKDTLECERAAQNRYVVEREHDDVKLKDLLDVKPRPIHLICTAANDMAGDPLGNLYRGARSAVLCANGISLGDEYAPLDDLRLSSALTASAAAFNSHMGRVSMDLGPAVTFLMSALNLRLGLWVPHPQYPYRGSYFLPGRFFLYELWGLSRANSKHLHLSDGNHFENFGLYELIRRHTRYIILSDCGADPEVAFDDLANVLRRVREDFGVEIDIEVSALRPGEKGLSKQHAVVGTIHYNGITGMDKGTIIFFKPALTGDEPPDVLQYRTRNPAFPHESTGDQFYDEPQWESYRRLGEHAARVILGFFDRPQRKASDVVERLFSEARSQWPPTPDCQNEGFLAMTERFIALEADLLANGPHHLRAEVLSEITELAGAPLDPPNPDDEMAIFSYLLRVMQMMEDVWLSADLGHYWSHPLNQGWMNYFYRWSSTASFRRWWPILSPMYSLGFREFAKDRFGVGVQDKSARSAERTITAGQLKLSVVQDRKGFLASRTWEIFQQRRSDFTIPSDPPTTLFQYALELLGYDGKASGKSLVIGFAIVKEEPFWKGLAQPLPKEAKEQEKWGVVWEASELYVPEALRGGGMTARLLDAVISHYTGAGASIPARQFVELKVRFTPERPALVGVKNTVKLKILPPAAREQRVQDIEFYKSRGFHYVRAEHPQTGEITLVRPIGAGVAA